MKPDPQPAAPRSRRVALLRGVNVGGRTVLKETLLQAFRDAGLPDAETYIQSGNVLFRGGGKDPAAVARSVERALEALGAPGITVLVRTAADLEAVLAANPFTDLPGYDEKACHVTFLEEEAPTGAEARLATEKKTRDLARAIGREVHIYCPDGYGRTVFHNAYIEKKLATQATTRNRNTVEALRRLAETRPA